MKWGWAAADTRRAVQQAQAQPSASAHAAALQQGILSALRIRKKQHAQRGQWRRTGSCASGAEQASKRCRRCRLSRRALL